MTSYRDRHLAGLHDADPEKREKAQAKLEKADAKEAKASASNKSAKN